MSRPGHAPFTNFGMLELTTEQTDSDLRIFQLTVGDEPGHGGSVGEKDVLLLFLCEFVQKSTNH